MSDPKPERKVRDPDLLKQLHREWTECALCPSRWPLSLHHVNRHPRDDVVGNLVMLCGSGTTGCHGLVEARQDVALGQLGRHLVDERPDTLEYLTWRYGELAPAWLERRYLVQWPLPPPILSP